MLEQFVQKLTELAAGEILEAHGKAYSRFQVHELETPARPPKAVELHTLAGVVDFIRTYREDFEDGCSIHVVSPTEVAVVSNLIGEFNQRFGYTKATPFLTGGFRFNAMRSIEEFVIALQACFVPDEQVEQILRVVGNVQAENVTTVTDDGVSQSVIARAGVARMEHVTVPNPVTLRPFRTFQEIEQPKSQYVLRMRRDGDQGLPTVGLFEVTDNQWQVEAVRAIQKYFESDTSIDVPVFA